jgi:HPt (histidine-containing phosphotransfer) domain-containing protein
MTLPGPVAPVPSPAPVLDIEAGVERLMGNRAIYLRALARFRSDYRDTAAALRSALAAADTVLAQRLAHTLKGAAGMIEAPRLHVAALVLEATLRDGRGDAATALARLDTELADVLRKLDGMDLRVDATPPRAPPAAGNATVASLRAMLDIGDGAAVDLVAAARSELSEHLGERGYEELSAAMEQFDYEAALEVLNEFNRTGQLGGPRQQAG